MSVLRILGLGLMIAALATAIITATHPVEPWNALTQSLSQVWASVQSPSLNSVQTAAEQHLPSQVGEAGVQKVLRLPVWALVGLVGLVFLLIGAAGRKSGALAPADAKAVGAQAPAPSLVPKQSPRSELAHALASCKSAFFSVGVFSGMSNVLMLTGAFFMLQIYDRILPSRSVPTLVALAILVAGLFTVLAIIDLIRSRLLVRIGASLDQALSGRVYDTIVRLPLRTQSRGDGLQPLRDLDAVRSFLSGPGPTALFDLPCVPLYLAIVQ